MISTLSDSFRRLLGLSWLTGPIFEKELRVSSRRKRNYFLRFAYLALLTALILVAWKTTARGPNSAVYQLSRMPEIGKAVITLIIWFQFLAIQFLAVVMLSSAISEEIHRRTLGVLMTTPISSLQIVLGKLLSKLLQLVLLLAISMPLLAIVRVFGGVPWDYVLSSLCVTLTAAVFAGSVSLLFSTHTRLAHQVVARTVLIGFLLYAGPSILVALVQLWYRVRLVSQATLSQANPFLIISYTSKNMLGGLPATFNVAWLGHCAIMAGLSALMLVISAISVRRVGLRQATGHPGIFASRKERRAARAKRRTGQGSAEMSGRIIAVKGPPIVWKEMRTMSVQIGRFTPVISGILAVLVLGTAYGYCAYKDYLAIEWVQAAFVLIYFLLGLLRAGTSAATSITSEKEARTWPVLLATPMTDRQIVVGKIIGSCLQSWAFWLLLTAHMLVFSFVGYISAAILPLAVLVVSSALLVSAVGVMFSSWCRRNSTSASANLLLLLGLVMPLCCPLPVYLVNPIFAALMILAVSGRWDIGVPFSRMGFGAWTSWLVTLSTSVLALVVLVGLYLLLALAATAVAVWKVRRKIY